MESVGTTIAKLRVEQGLTQEELAKGIGTDQGTISKIELGKAGLSWDRGVAIADFLRVPLDRITGSKKRRR